MKLSALVIATLLSASHVAGQNSSTGVGPSPESSTGVGPTPSSTGAGPTPDSSTGATAAPTASPTHQPTCATQTNCNSCFNFKEGCVWCFVPSAGVNATVACVSAADHKTCPELPTPFTGLDLLTHGKQACDLSTCMEDAHADTSATKAVNDFFMKENQECFDKFNECLASTNKTDTDCKFECALKGESDLGSNCTAIPHGGEVCSVSASQTLSEYKNGTWTTQKSWSISVPDCLPKSCASVAILSSIADLAFNDTGNALPGCQPPFDCKREASFQCASVPVEPAKTGLSTGTIIAIIAGSCLGLALVCYCGAQSCKKKDNDYEAF